MRLLLQMAKIAISVAVIFYLASKYDLLNAFEVIIRQKPAFLIIGTAILCIQIAIAAFRWNSVVTALARSIAISKVVKAFYVAAFLNTCFPAGVAGDIARIWLIRANEMGLTRAFNSVLIDRIVTVLTLLILGTLMEPFVWQHIVIGKDAFLIIPLLTVLGVVGIVALTNLDRIPAINRALVALRLDRLTSILDSLASDSRAVFLTGRGLATTIGFGLASHVTVAIAVYVFAVGLNVDITMAQCQLVMPIILLVTSLPISVGGWGPRELAMVYLFGAFGVPPAEALTLSIQFGVCSMLAATPGAVVWIMWGNRARASA
jgi:glycosyltransferase 2 family protein